MARIVTDTCVAGSQATARSDEPSDVTVAGSRRGKTTVPSGAGGARLPIHPAPPRRGRNRGETVDAALGIGAEKVAGSTRPIGDPRCTTSRLPLVSSTMNSSRALVRACNMAALAGRDEGAGHSSHAARVESGRWARLWAHTDDISARSQSRHASSRIRVAVATVDVAVSMHADRLGATPTLAGVAPVGSTSSANTPITTTASSSRWRSPLAPPWPSPAP